MKKKIHWRSIEQEKNDVNVNTTMSTYFDEYAKQAGEQALHW